MSHSHLLRRAALAASAAAVFSAAAMRDSSDPLPLSGLVLGSSSPTAYETAPGHLGLARSHQGLRELNALLTPEAFLLDATRALSAGALRYQPMSAELLRLFRGVAPELIAKQESDGEVEAAKELRIKLALLDAEDGRFGDALDALARLSAKHPSDPRPRLCAAMISYFVGLLEEGNQWLAGIPEEVRKRNKLYLHRAIIAATLGGAPGAVAGFEGLVGYMAAEPIDLALAAKFYDGDISLFKKMVFSGLLRRLVAGKYRDYLKGKVSQVQPLEKNDLM